MTSLDSIDIRELIFINRRCQSDYETLPPDVRESADQAMDALQNGRVLSPKLRRQLHGRLAGIDEIRLPFDDDTYRVYSTLKCLWAVIVLDAGIKKSTAGSNIPRWQQERLLERFGRARHYCLAKAVELEADYHGRKVRRSEMSKGR